MDLQGIFQNRKIRRGWTITEESRLPFSSTLLSITYLGSFPAPQRKTLLIFKKNLLTSDVICSALRYGGPCRIRCIHHPSAPSAALGGVGENLILTYGIEYAASILNT